MIKNYIKIALRNLSRHKGYSFINIAGLAIGMACCILILLWVQDELSFDRFHKNADSIYHFMDEVIDNLYRAEHQIGTLFRYFSILAILISCVDF
ncbi:MAG: ABC transporter permease [Candidatus Aminicenantaceae bacterium]